MLSIKKQITAVNHWKGRNGHKVKGCVIHSTWGGYEGSVQWFKNPKAAASAHYVINTDGGLSLCVEEKDAAWHAGVVTVDKGDAPKILKDNWDTNLNFVTIGVEVVDNRNRNHDYPAPQYEACVLLVSDICKRYDIKVDAGHIIMHKQVDPINKSDPVGSWNHQQFIEDVRKQIEFGSFVEGGVEEPRSEFYPIEPVKQVTVYPDSDGVYVRSEPIRRNVKRPHWAWPFFNIVQTNLSGSKTVAPGKWFRAKGFVKGEEIDGNPWWWVSEFDNYVWSGATVDKPNPDDYPESVVDKISKGKKNMGELRTELERLETARDVALAEVAEAHRAGIEAALAAVEAAEVEVPVEEEVAAVEEEVADEVVAAVEEAEAPVEEAEVVEEVAVEVETPAEEVETVVEEEVPAEDPVAAELAELEARVAELKGQ